MQTYFNIGDIDNEQGRLWSDWSIFPKAFTDQFHFRFGKARKSRQRLKKKTTRSTNISKSAITVRNFLCWF